MQVRAATRSSGTTVALATTIILWASAFVAIRAAVPFYGPLGLTVARLAVASVALAAVTVPRISRRPTPRELARLTLAGLLGMSGYQLLLNIGQTRVTAATASVVVATAPMLTAALAWRLLKERSSAWLWIGMGVAFAGILIAALGEGSGLRAEPAIVLVLIAAAALAAYFIAIKPLLRSFSPLEVTAWSTWIGTLLALPLVPALMSQVAAAPAEAHLAVLHLGVGASALGFFSWSVALRDLPASAAATYLYLVPPTAAVIGWLWLGEVPAVLAVLGGVITLGGVALARRPRRSDL